jgi:hypothetical protein
MKLQEIKLSKTFSETPVEVKIQMGSLQTTWVHGEEKELLVFAQV